MTCAFIVTPIGKWLPLLSNERYFEIFKGLIPKKVEKIMSIYELLKMTYIGT